MTKRFGFTLAEVLITLGIIGVVAAMTIPTLMNSTGQAEFKSGFKKAISGLNQAITMNVALEDTDFSAMSSNSTSLTSASPYAMFSNRMNVIKSATDADATTLGVATGATNYTLFFNDGMAISWTLAATTGSVTAPISARVDVNGIKKPNKLTLCGGATSATGTTATEGTLACTDADLKVADQFSVRMFDQTVLPAGPAARYIMYK